MLGAEGAKLALAARSADKLEALSAELGGGALALPTDLTQAADVKRIVQGTIENFGRIDVLVANAGTYLAGDIADGDSHQWDAVISVNVSVFRAVRGDAAAYDGTGQR